MDTAEKWRRALVAIAEHEGLLLHRTYATVHYEAGVRAGHLAAARIARKALGVDEFGVYAVRTGEVTT